MEERKVITAAEMAQMTPQQRSDAFDASICRSWDEVAEPFRIEVLETAREFTKRFKLDD